MVLCCKINILADSVFCLHQVNSDYKYICCSFEMDFENLRVSINLILFCEHKHSSRFILWSSSGISQYYKYIFSTFETVFTIRVVSQTVYQFLQFCVIKSTFWPFHSFAIFRCKFWLQHFSVVFRTVLNIWGILLAIHLFSLILWRKIKILNDSFVGLHQLQIHTTIYISEKKS